MAKVARRELDGAKGYTISVASGASAGHASTPAGKDADGEFKRIGDLTVMLVKVPKSEVDVERKKG